VNGCETNLNSSTGNCGTCGKNCASPAPSNATGEACSSGSCAITGCSTGTYNTNGVFTDGCECVADAVNDSCSGASVLSTIYLGASSTAASGNITPGTDIDWYQVTFSGNWDCSYHPKIVLNDVSGLLVMDIAQNSCSGGAFACGTEGGTSTSKTIFEISQLNASSSCGYQGIPDPSTYSSLPTTFFVKVYKGAGSSSSCLPYSLTISN
jgi:hypothetical protein